MFSSRHNSVNVNQKLKSGKYVALADGRGLPDVRRPKASQFGSLPAVDGSVVKSRLLADAQRRGMSSAAHFKALEQTLLTTSPEAGPAVAEDYEAENSRTSIIRGEQAVYDQYAATLSQSHS